MTLLAGFLEVLFKALALIGMASAVGGVVFVLAVLRPMDKTVLYPAALRRSLVLIAVGGAMLAVAQSAVLLVEPWALADELGRWPLSQFLGTRFAHAGIIHAGMAAGLSAAAIRLLGRPFSLPSQAVMIVFAVLLMSSGAWLVHAVSRLNHVAPLMAVTVLHQFGVSVWAGGILHLSALWRLTKKSPELMAQWPSLVARFSPLAMVSIGTLVAAGFYLSLHYIGGVDGLFGTAFGAMVLTKTALLCLALCLGGLNFLNVRRWRQRGDAAGLSGQTPAFVEVEAGTAIAILFAAAALTSQPPAVDVLAERATPTEVLQVFMPKTPQLVPPPHDEMLSQAASDFDIFAVSSKLDKVQSNFNHNVAGLLVLLTAVGAFLGRFGKARLKANWPLLFMPLALFLFLYGEPNGWPLGTEGFWETLVVPGVLQHRLATLLVVVLALFEWRVRADGLGTTKWRFAFPLLCGVGGVLLLTHSHSVFAVKSEFLIEISHNAIGFLAVLMGAARWLELSLPGPSPRLPGLLWICCMLLIGFVLLFYREA